MNAENAPAVVHPVWLVGAGPGGAELLTLQAVRALRQATVVLVDDLVADDVLRCVRRRARIVHVGKRGGCASTPQPFIERLMVAEALKGERVVRLKGGDPFVFGRGGEEARALAEAGIPVRVASGLTAGIAVPASWGVPVTDRRHTPGVAFVTGHGSEGGSGHGGPDWAALARSRLTLVVYMGVTRCDAIVQALLDGGLPATTPAAVMQDGCSPASRRLTTTLARLADDVRAHGFAAPALLVVGDVLRAAVALGHPVPAGVDATPPAAAAAG